MARDRPGLSWRVRLLMIVALLATIGIYGGSVLLSTTRDRVDQIDTKAVESAATAACTTLRVELDALPPLPTTASDDERDARIRLQAAALERFTDRVERVGPRALDQDVPTRTWLGDWAGLLQARQDFAATGFTGAFAVPVEDGQPITRRMDAIGVDACRVPQSLLDSP